MNIQLSESEKISLEDQHKKEKNSRVCDRIKAVLLSSEGWSQSQIAQALRIHENTVSVHLHDYLEKNKLSNESGGSKSYLTKEQTDELIMHLEQNTYPDTKEIISYVCLIYGVKYTQQGMYDWLKSNRFSYKHPKGVPLKHNKGLQEKFKNKYNELKRSLFSNEKIFFMDSVHPTQATKITSGWIRKGVEKMIATVAGRKRINLTGAVDLKSMSIFTKDYETVNGESTIDFLKYLDASTEETELIHLIADGGSAHTCMEVGAFLGIKDPFNKKYLLDNYQIKFSSPKVKLSGKIKKRLKKVLDKEPELFTDNAVLEEKGLTTQAFLDSLKSPPAHHKFVLHILPPYSPNLNPIERVWKLMNERIRNNEIFSTFKKFKDAVIGFFKDEWDKITIDELRSRINDNFEELKPLF
jgi:transposase